MSENDLRPCACSDHEGTERSRLYNANTQYKVYHDFLDNDVPRVHTLRLLEELFGNETETRPTTDYLEHIGKIFLDHNKEHICGITGKKYEFSFHTLNCIWKVALSKSSKYISNKNRQLPDLSR